MSYDLVVFYPTAVPLGRGDFVVVRVSNRVFSPSTSPLDVGGCEAHRT